MAVGNENPPAPRGPRTPLPHGKIGIVKEGLSQHIKVSATDPCNNVRQIEPREQEDPSSGQRLGEPQDGPSDEKTEENQNGHQTEKQNMVDHSAELPPLDWPTLEREYTDALRKANAEEEDLVAQFNKVVDCFACWAEASGGRDDERALKRLKTRGLYVQLAEEKLANKTARYGAVVEAFKRAVDMLDI